MRRNSYLRIIEYKRGMINEIFFLEKTTSVACLFGSGLKDIFHWYAHFSITLKSKLRSWNDIFTSKTVEKVSSAKSLIDERRFSGKSLM